MVSWQEIFFLKPLTAIGSLVFRVFILFEFISVILVREKLSGLCASLCRSWPNSSKEAKDLLIAFFPHRGELEFFGKLGSQVFFYSVFN